jgi:hypothetical protein
MPISGFWIIRIVLGRPESKNRHQNNFTTEDSSHHVERTQRKSFGLR